MLTSCHVITCRYYDVGWDKTWWKAGTLVFSFRSSARPPTHPPTTTHTMTSPSHALALKPHRACRFFLPQSIAPLPSFQVCWLPGTWFPPPPISLTSRTSIPSSRPGRDMAARAGPPGQEAPGPGLGSTPHTRTAGSRRARGPRPSTSNRRTNSNTSNQPSSPPPSTPSWTWACPRTRPRRTSLDCWPNSRFVSMTLHGNLPVPSCPVPRPGV